MTTDHDKLMYDEWMDAHVREHEVQARRAREAEDTHQLHIEKESEFRKELDHQLKLSCEELKESLGHQIWADYPQPEDIPADLWYESVREVELVDVTTDNEVWM